MAPHLPVDIGEAETCEFPNVLVVVCTSIHGHQHLGETGLPIHHTTRAAKRCVKLVFSGV